MTAKNASDAARGSGVDPAGEETTPDVSEEIAVATSAGLLRWIKNRVDTEGMAVIRKGDFMYQLIEKRLRII